MLRLLKRDLHEDLKKFPGSLQIENESQLPFIGIYIVQAAMGTVQATENIRLPEGSVSSKLLEKDGEIAETFLKKHGEQTDHPWTDITENWIIEVRLKTEIQHEVEASLNHFLRQPVLDRLPY